MQRGTSLRQPVKITGLHTGCPPNLSQRHMPVDESRHGLDAPSEDTLGARGQCDLIDEADVTKLCGYGMAIEPECTRRDRLHVGTMRLVRLSGALAECRTVKASVESGGGRSWDHIHRDGARHTDAHCQLHEQTAGRPSLPPTSNPMQKF
jgi:hypothetical protein